MDAEAASKKCRNAGIAAGIQGVLSFAVVCFAIYSGADSDNPALKFYNDPTIFIDVAIIFVLAGGLFLKSRTAAVLLPIYVVVSKIFFIAETGRVSGIGLWLVFIYFYYQGIVGAFVFTRLRRGEDPTYRKKPAWLIAVVIAGLLLAGGLVGLGLVTTLTDAPSTAVEGGEDLPDSYPQWLRENGVIDADETIEMFYSEGMLSIEVGGNLLTNRRAISYFKNDKGELEIHYAEYDEIIALNIQREGGFLSDSIVEVVYGTEQDQGWFYLLLSAENGGDRKFIDLLEQRTGLSAELVEPQPEQE